MAAANGGLGGSCFLEDDCGPPLVCQVEGVGGKMTHLWVLFILITFLSVHEGTCRLPGWAMAGLVGAVVFLLLALFCCVCCFGLLRRRRRAKLGASGSDLVMFG